MKEIKIFLASSNKLAEERNEIEKLISRMNDDFVTQGIYLRLVIWEKLSSSFSVDRKQAEFNQTVLESDVFICLIHDKIGQFSKEEFDAAYEGFTTKKKPRNMYIYFCNKPLFPNEITDDYNSVLNLKKSIQGFEQFYSTYDNTESLLFQLKRNFDLDLPKFMENSLIEELEDILNSSNPGIMEVIRRNGQASILVTNDEYQRLDRIKNKLLSEKIVEYQSNGNMIQNRPDGLMRTGFVVNTLENFPK